MTGEGKALVTQNQDAFMVMDQAEGMEMIESLIAGHAEIATYVYDFPVGGTHVYGVSLPGCTASLRHKCAQQVAKELPPLDFEYTTTADRYDKFRDAWLCEVQLKEKTTGMVGLGRVYQPRLFVTKDKSKPPKENQFFDRIAFSKAKRNAIRDFLDEEFIKTMIQLFIKQGRSKTIADKDRAKFIDQRVAALPKPKAKPTPKPKPEAPTGTPATDEDINSMESMWEQIDVSSVKGWAQLAAKGYDEKNITKEKVEDVIAKCRATLKGEVL